MSQPGFEAVERWFLQRGLPNLTYGYSASTDVFTRASPLLVFLWFLSVAGAYGDRFQGWHQAFAAVGGAAILLAAAAGVNWIKGRRLMQVPDRVGLLELAAFVLVPAMLPVVLGDGSVVAFVTTVVLQLVTLLVVAFTYGFGLVSIMRWAVGNLGRQLSDVFGLMTRALPLVLVFTMFLFLNAELWQVADDFTWPLFAAACIGLVAVATTFVLVRLPAELEDIAKFADTADVVRLIEQSDAPIEAGFDSEVMAPPLTRVDRVNVMIVALFAVAVQIALVMLIVGVFYLLFGLVTVRTQTIAQWTEGGSEGIGVIQTFTLFGDSIALTTELVKVSGFLMAFTALQFTVSALTDATYRQEFFEDLTTELREALAVRVAYLHQLGVVEDRGVVGDRAADVSEPSV